MSELERSRKQLDKGFYGDAWHGPALEEVLDGISPEQATVRPIPDAHTIWEIVLHLATWRGVVRRRLEGERVDDVPTEVDWPPVPDTSEEAWAAARQALRDEQANLQTAIAALSEDQLESEVPGLGYSFYTMLHGLIHHDLYHAGQIAILRKSEPQHVEQSTDQREAV